jgi:beta-glucosidase/6-phospho-beta-glucosidase/beta-galactosidase
MLVTHGEGSGVSRTRVCKPDGALQAAADFQVATPWSGRRLVAWMSRRYGSPPIYVSENGWAALEASEAPATGVHDEQRVHFLANYTCELLRAIREDGVDLRGYFYWTLMDNFEWQAGFAPRFGLYHVDFNSLRRTPKASARYYAAIARTNSIPDPVRDPAESM